MIRVLYDGWPLSHNPGSPAAVHLIELLSCLPDTVEPWLALPQETHLPPALDRVRTVVQAAASTPASRLRWEQMNLPAAGRRVSAHLLHLTTPYPPLLATLPCLYSPAVETKIQGIFNQPSSPPGLAARLRESIGSGGLSGLRALLWPEDLPAPQGTAPVFRLPPVAHNIFFTDLPPASSLPDSFVLCPGPLGDDALPMLAAAWSWVCAGLGDEWALMVSDLSPAQIEMFHQVCEEKQIADSLVPVCFSGVEDRAEAFQRASVVLSITDGTPWGDPLLQALACGRPVAGWETPTTDARLGPAGYLVPFGDTRALGSAIVTLLVEESVAELISQKARERSQQWDRSRFKARLLETYQQAVDK